MAYDCTKGIQQSVTSDCTTAPTGGLEVEAWMWNRVDITPTYDATNPNKITALTPSGTTVAYKLKGWKKNMNCGHDRTIGEDVPDSFKHYFSFKGFEFGSDHVLNIDKMHDVVVAVERKDKASDEDGTFVAYGMKTGLWPSSDTKRENDANGIRSVELTSLEGQDEPYSQYNIVVTAGTRAALEALLT